jgi:Zn-dependent protease
VSTGNILLAIFAMPVFLVVVGIAFILHELAHRLIARKYGYWAEFRAHYQGLLYGFLIAVITTLLGHPFVFILPGAVMIYPIGRFGFIERNVEKTGKIAAAGPMVNILLAVIFGITSTFFGAGLLGNLLAAGATVNAFLAVFNMLPLHPLDGSKVFAWKKELWVLIMGLAIGILGTLRQ